MNTEKLRGIVKAVRKWKDDFIVVIELKNGEIVLGTERDVEFSVKPGEHVEGIFVDGTFQIDSIVTIDEAEALCSEKEVLDLAVHLFGVDLSLLTAFKKEQEWYLKVQFNHRTEIYHYNAGRFSFEGACANTLAKVEV